MRVYDYFIPLFVIIVLYACSPKKYVISGTYGSDLFSRNFIRTTINLGKDSVAHFWRIGDAMRYHDSGIYKIHKDTLRIFYTPARFTAADRDSFIKYKILPFPLDQSEIKPKNSDNYFLIRRNKLLYLDSLGHRHRKHKTNKVYFLKKLY